MSIACQAVQRRNCRVDRYRQLVRPIALHYAHRCAEPLDDLIQVGLLGLLRASELYSETSSTPFSAFARPHIRGAILHYLRDVAPPIRLPRRVSELLDLRRRCVRQLSPAQPAAVADEELRLAMGLSTAQWQRLEQARRLNQLSCLADQPEQAWSFAQQGASDARDCDHQALEALQRLEPKLAAVVRAVVLRGCSYRHAAAQLAVSPMTVQRRLHRGLAELRKQLGVTPPADWCPVPSAAPGC